MIADLPIHLPGILLAYTVLALGILSPGPAVLAIIGTSMARGRVLGLSLALGVVCGSVFWGVLSAAGMAAILTGYAQALVALKFIGGCFMLWLAFKSFKAARAGNVVERKVLAGSKSKMWLTGLLIHLTNPKAVLAWIATISLGVTAQSPLWVSFAIVMGGAVISLAGNCAYALVFSTKPMEKLYKKAIKPIQYAFAGFFTFAGFKMLLGR